MSKKVLHIFDLDDTLTVTPTFADFVGADIKGMVNIEESFPKYFKSIKGGFWHNTSKDVYFKKSGDFIVVINKADDKPFDENVLKYFHGRKWDRALDVVNGVIVLKAYPGFHGDPETIGKKLNDPIYNIYKSAQNKMILTGRDEKLRHLIEKELDTLDVKYPNYGFFMYSHPKYPNIRSFKAMVIVDSILQNAWDEVHFYEDREDWLKIAVDAVRERFSEEEVKFVPHFVSNVKKQQSHNY